MSLSYKPLWDMLDEKGISKMEFAKSVDISNATLAKMGKDEAISLTTVDKICNVYDCDIENIVKHISSMKMDGESSQILEIGTIILADRFLSEYRFSSSPSKLDCYYVITSKKSNEQMTIFDDTKNYTYKVAVLSTHLNKNDLCIPVLNLKIKNKKMEQMYLHLDTIRTFPSHSLFHIVGSVPNTVLEKILKFNAFIETL